jgi:MFS family permease
MTIGFLAMAFGSVFWGTVKDRIGPRTVVITGSVLLAVSLALASFSRLLLEFQLLFGLLVGHAEYIPHHRNDPRRGR